MQVKMKQNRFGASGVLLAAGTTQDLADSLAAELVGQGAAEYVGAQPSRDLVGEPVRMKGGQLTPDSVDAVRGAVAGVGYATTFASKFSGERGVLIADWSSGYSGSPSAIDVLPEPSAPGLVAQLPSGLTNISCAATPGAQSSSMRSVGFWAKADRRPDGQMSNVVYLEFGADSTFANACFVAVSIRADGKWRFYTTQSQAPSAWGVTGSFVIGTTQFTHVRVRESNSLCNSSVRPALKSGQTIEFGPIYRNPTAAPFAFVRLDDGLVDAFVPRQTLAAPFVGMSGVSLPAGVPMSALDVTEAFGLRAIMYVLTRHIGDAEGGFLTAQQLRTLQDEYGWDIGFQSHANPISANNLGVRLLGPDGFNARPVGGISGVSTSTGVVTASSNHNVTVTSGPAGNQGYPVELIGSGFPEPSAGGSFAAGSIVWLRQNTATTFTMHRTEKDACLNTNVITFVSAGSPAEWGYRYRGAAADSAAIARDFDAGQQVMMGLGFRAFRHYAPNQGAWDINSERVVQQLIDEGKIVSVNGTCGNNGASSTNNYALRIGRFTPSAVFGFSGNTPQGSSGSDWMSLPVSMDTHAGGADAETGIRAYVRDIAARGGIGSNYHHHFSTQASLKNFVVYCDEIRRLVDQGILMTGTPSEIYEAIST